MFEIENIYFDRCIKPLDVSDEDPVRIIFSDSSTVAFGACAYIRWKLADGSFDINLLIAKTHVSPINLISIVRLENILNC